MRERGMRNKLEEEEKKKWWCSRCEMRKAGILVMVALIAILPLAVIPVAGDGASRTIIDTAGRTVTIDKPVTKIVVLSSDGARALRLFGDEDKVVGISETIQTNPDYFPVMSQKTVVGTWREVDWEEVIALDPDLVITYPTGSISADVAATQLDPFGIAVVGLNLYPVSGDFDDTLDELEKLAVLLEREDKAEQYIAWHDGYLTEVEEFVADEAKPDVFLTYTAGSVGKTSEIKSYGPGAIDYELCVKAGGMPITEDVATRYPSVSAEWVLSENPDIIILKCGNVFGWWDSEAEPQQKISEMLAGKSWDNVSATVNNEIYAVPWSITNGLEHIYGVVLLAKICHPSLPIDPEEVYKEFIEDFLRLDYPEGEGKVLVYPPV
jgi:iron complex transport system substrate-binding protein